MGACPTILYGHNREISKKQSRIFAFTTLGIFAAGLLVFAIEGIICVAMAAPFGLLLTWLGSMIGFAIVNKTSGKGPPAMILLIMSIPLTAFMEQTDTIQHTIEVTTSIDIDADRHTVWLNVIEFPELGEPEEFLFKAGIAYPISADIEGKNVGAIRHCNFSTGSFVEPITIWEEPRLLKFDVVENPAPMKELSMWDINAPHLHDYFVSKEGQFKLIELPNGRTRLEGTTWYTHNIKPEFYWRIWSNYIVHTIHLRVLNHIKDNSEKTT